MGVRLFNLPAPTGAASALAVAGFPAFVAAGTAGGVKVTARDPAGNTAAGYRGTVHFTSSDPAATLPADYTFTAADNGTHTFTNGVTLRTAGTQSLTVTDVAMSAVAGAQAGIAVHTTPVTLIPVPTHRDLVFDGTRNLLYITTSGGTVERYDVAAQTLLAPLRVGNTLYGADVTPDGGSLYVAEGQRNVAQEFLRKVSLATGAVTNLPFDRTSLENGAWAVAISANGKGLFDTRIAGSAFVPLRQLDTSTDTLSIRSDGPGSVTQNTNLRRGADRSLLFLTLSNISTGPIYTYDAASNTFPNHLGTNQFLDDALSAINRNGTLIALESGANIVVRDRNLNTVTTLSNLAGGLAFDPLRDLLYAVNTDTAQVVAYDTTTWAERYRLSIGESIGSSGAFGSGVMVVSNDAKHLFLATPTGVRVLDLPSPSFQVSGFPSSATAGTPLTFTVTAKDAQGNTDPTYTGTVHFTSSDPAATLPADYTFSAADNGTHTFPNGVTLKTAGNQTVTATDTASTTGTSGTITVNPAAASKFAFSGLPALAITDIAFTFTVRALDAFNNTATGYSGTVHFTSSAAAILPANSPLTNGTGTFQATLNTTGSQTLTATDTANSSVTGTSPAITVRGLIVTAFTPTATGFTATFSKPFVNSSTSPLHIYDSVQAGYGPADVTLIGSGNIDNVRGSLVIDSSNTSFTFVKTGGPVGGGTTGLLAAGTYTVTFLSGRLGFRDANQVALDGNNSGVPGANYVTAFTVSALNSVAVTVPDFARGPDATHAINVPNNSTNGIPIALSNGAGVTDGTFVLQYNANLLTITGGTVNAALTGATFTVTTSGSGTSARATVTFHSPAALASGAVRLGGLVATVPANAPYKSKELLHFSSLALNGGAIPAVGDDGVHAIMFLGDATGDGVYTSADSVLISRVAAGADSGFLNFPVLDPVIAGDITGDGRITAADATALNLYISGTTVTQVPTWPGVPSNLPAGPDPALSIPTVRVGPGGTVTVPVLIDDLHPAGSSGLTQAVLALRYDPALFDVSAADIHLGTVLAGGAGWTLQAVVDPTTGQIGIVLFSLTPIRSSLGGSLVTINFHVKPRAHAGASPINLVPAVTVNGRALYTALYDLQGPLTLHAAPTAAADDPGVDGFVVLTAEPAAAGNRQRPTVPDSLARLFSLNTDPELVEHVFLDFIGGMRSPAGRPLMPGGSSDGLDPTTAGFLGTLRAAGSVLAALVEKRAAAALSWLPLPGSMPLQGRARGWRELLLDGLAPAAQEE
jgi:hypothetical protein